jgi:hypothetical protein
MIIFLNKQVLEIGAHCVTLLLFHCWYV